MDRAVTDNAYTSATTERYNPLASNVAIIVSNSPVFAQFAVSYGNFHPAEASFPIEEIYLHPTVWRYTTADFPGGRGIGGVRFRSAFEDRPAVVTARAGR